MDTFMGVVIGIISEISSLQILICFQNGNHLKWKPMLFKESQKEIKSKCVLLLGLQGY